MGTGLSRDTVKAIECAHLAETIELPRPRTLTGIGARQAVPCRSQHLHAANHVGTDTPAAAASGQAAIRSGGTPAAARGSAHPISRTGSTRTSAFTEFAMKHSSCAA